MNLASFLDIQTVKHFHVLYKREIRKMFPDKVNEETQEVSGVIDGFGYQTIEATKIVEIVA